MPLRFQKVTLRSFAKINLGLHILGKRRDGYHEIRTLFQSLVLHDSLIIRRTRGRQIRFRCNLRELGASNNLVVKAVRLFRQETGVSGGFDIQLEKRIPLGSGMGGGSSNAATTLLGLCRLFNLAVPTEVLLDWGGALGSDVPFFFLGGRALGIGRGAEVYPIEEPPKRHVLLAIPGTGVSTVDAYRRLSLQLTKRVGASKIPVFCSGFLDTLGLGQGQENDFEALFFEDFPELRELKKGWLECGAEAAGLSGSGSALFGVFAAKRDLKNAVQVGAGRQLRFIQTRTLARAEYRKGIVESLQ